MDGTVMRFVGTAHHPPLPPIFKNLPSALLWAYRAQIDATDTSQIFRLGGKGERDEDRRAPTKLNLAFASWEEAVAQKGFIKAAVNRLEPSYRLAVVAAYALGQERREARAGLVRCLLPTLRSGLTHRRLVLLLVVKACGGSGLFFNHLAERFGVSARTIARTYWQISAELDVLRYRAEAILHVRFQTGGIIE